eukprot:1597226-Pleurochrysis_carterae.AAC.4
MSKLDLQWQRGPFRVLILILARSKLSSTTSYSGSKPQVNHGLQLLHPDLARSPKKTWFSLSGQPAPRKRLLPMAYIRSGHGGYPIYPTISVDRCNALPMTPSGGYQSFPLLPFPSWALQTFLALKPLTQSVISRYPSEIAIEANYLAF